jgi:hypothetical protein
MLSIRARCRQGSKGAVAIEFRKTALTTTERITKSTRAKISRRVWDIMRRTSETALRASYRVEPGRDLA